MNKILITAALLAATLVAKAQGTAQKPIVSSKCFVCAKPFSYHLYPQSETLIIRDTTYTIDWATKSMVIDGEDLDIKKVVRTENSVSVSYGEYLTVTLTLYYEQNRCIDYKFSK